METSGRPRRVEEEETGEAEAARARIDEEVVAMAIAQSAGIAM